MSPLDLAICSAWGRVSGAGRSRKHSTSVGFGATFDIAAYGQEGLGWI